VSLSRRLTLSLLAILLIFSLNVATHFWGSFARTENMTAYRSSVSAQELATSIGTQLEEQRKQVLFLATLRETTEDRLGEQDQRQAQATIGNVVETLRQLGRVTHDVTRPQYDELWLTSLALLPAWQDFYRNYNDSSWIPSSPAADVQGQYDAMRQQLSALKQRQSFIAEQQTAIIDSTIALTDRIMTIGFVASILLSSILGFFLIRYTNTSFSRLKTGTLRIGSGDLNYRIDDIEDVGELGELAKAFNDMSDKLRNAIEEVRHAKENADKANQAKSNFLASVSHELRTPLNAIIGYSEMLFDELGDRGEVDREQFQTDLDKIILSGKQLLSLINDILDLSKIETGKMTIHAESFDVAESLQQICHTIEPLLGKNENSLEISTSEELPPLFNDATKFRQVFVNLLSNASKFTHAGHIRLSAEPLQGKEPRVLFCVSDNGIGMSADELEHIFEAFVQAGSSTSKIYGGTGLGLAICKDYCELMGGDIAVESEPGVGTTFRVNLPVQIHAPASDPASD
jgi:signal transduction histidine kinase